MRRAADSIVSNIAEGGGKNTDREVSLFLRHAIGSANELEAQIGRAWKLRYFDDVEEELSREIVEIRKMLIGFNRRFGKIFKD